MGGLTLALLALCSPQSAADEWSRAWEGLSAVEAAAEGAERERALSALAEKARASAGEARGRILGAHLARLFGEPVHVELAPEELAALDAREAWLAARVLAPGPALDRALVRALEGLAEPELDSCRELAFARFVEHSEAFRTSSAERLARALHARSGAVWSAVNLAGLLRRSGRAGAACSLLSAELGRAPREAHAALLQERALVALGAGWDERARDDLGAALTRGSSDAAVVLGLWALLEGRPARARALFRGALRQDPRQAWALRGWGLSMLPAGGPRL